MPRKSWLPVHPRWRPLQLQKIAPELYADRHRASRDGARMSREEKDEHPCAGATALQVVAQSQFKSMGPGSSGQIAVMDESVPNIIGDPRDEIDTAISSAGIPEESYSFGSESSPNDCTIPNDLGRNGTHQASVSDSNYSNRSSIVNSSSSDRCSATSYISLEARLHNEAVKLLEDLEVIEDEENDLWVQSVEKCKFWLQLPGYEDALLVNDDSTSFCSHEHLQTDLGLPSDSVEMWESISSRGSGSRRDRIQWWESECCRLREIVDCDSVT